MLINLIKSNIFFLLILANSYVFGAENFQTSASTIFENISPRLLQKTTNLVSIKIVVPN